MQMSPKTVNYGRKNLGFGDGRFLQKPRFRCRFRIP